VVSERRRAVHGELLLGETLDADRVQANCHNGALTLGIP